MSVIFCYLMIILNIVYILYIYLKIFFRVLDILKLDLFGY